MNYDWLERLQTLLGRFNCMGLNADIGTLTLIDLRGVYSYLSRLASH